MRRLHQILTIAFVASLPWLNTWVWQSPQSWPVFALRFAFGAAALMIGPILLLRWLDPPTSAFIVRARRSHAAITRIPVPLIGVSRPMQLAALVTEDPYFFWHIGFNPVEIVRAFLYNRNERRPGRNRRGASTISQQVAKNLFLFPAQSYLRKALEIPLTLLLEGLWPKWRILEVYLNIAEFAPGIYGVEAAAQHFFAKPAAALNEAEASLLAADLRAPRCFRVLAPSAAMRAVQADTLQRMRWCGEGMLAQLRCF